MSGHRQWSEIRASVAQEGREPLRTLGDLRRESGLNQQEIADELGVSQANISKVERQADPQLSTLMRYLDALGANLEVRAVFPTRSVQLYFLADSEATELAQTTEVADDGEGPRATRVS